MTDTRLTMMQAIAEKQTVTARYNGAQMTLAPHLMFERHGDLFVSALNLDKNWRSQDERHLGHFKLDGLGAARLTGEGFDPLASFRPTPPREQDMLVLAV